jgi:hypothetical protein
MQGAADGAFVLTADAVVLQAVRDGSNRNKNKNKNDHVDGEGTEAQRPCACTCACACLRVPARACAPACLRCGGAWSASRPRCVLKSVAKRGDTMPVLGRLGFPSSFPADQSRTPATLLFWLPHDPCPWMVAVGLRGCHGRVCGRARR